MSSENAALAWLRMEQADQSLRAAQVLLDNEMARDSVNRSYYAMFYAVLALLVTRSLGTSKHQSAIKLFDREFVLTGLFTREHSRNLHRVFELRLRHDYRDTPQVPLEAAEDARVAAQDFVQASGTFLLDHGFGSAENSEIR